MKDNLQAFGNMINRRQILIGLAGLLFGSLVYLVDRPPDQTYFVCKSGIDVSLHNTLPNLFGLFGNNLPGFIHVFSFILITAALLSCQKRGYLITCISWLIVDSAFELGQKFNLLAVKIIPDWVAGIPFLENTENYFLQGTFDFFDLASIITGAVMAYLVLKATMERRLS